MVFKAECRTTAMGIMPHKDIERAFQLAFSLDIPFWPQLPNVSYFEDMYVQASEHFPGIIVDMENKKLRFDTGKFSDELVDYSQKMSDEKTFALTDDYSIVYRKFLEKDLGKYATIRGQMIGPVSFGFRVTDENNSPIIYNEEVKVLLLDFIQRKVNAQYRELRKKNPNAFIWLDEPGLGWVFSGLSGYDDTRAKKDYRDFLSGIDGLKALHLCANVNLPYLLSMGNDLLSFDAYQIELMPKDYARSIANFVSGGGIISWGIVPTDSYALEKETPETLAKILTGYWEVVSKNSGMPVEKMAGQALLAPARCCLKNIGAVGACGEAAKEKLTSDMTAEEQVVQEAFDCLRELSETLKNRFGLKDGPGVSDAA